MNPNSRLKVFLPLLGALLAVGGMWVGYLLADGDRLSPAQEKLNTIFELIEDEYVDEVSPDSLIEMTIPELLNNLDPHSVYIPAKDIDRLGRELEGSFYGVGVQFQIMGDSICVVEVIAGGPAERVGVQAGDRIVAVDGKPLDKNIQNDDVLAMLRGDKDTRVKITVKRATSKTPLEFDIVRGEIPSVSVDASYIVDDNIGYVRVSKFAANTFSEFLQAMASLASQGAESYILDLRGNSGGLVDQAILMANEFLEPMRTIVEVKGRNTRENANWLADGTGSFTDQPLVILVDEFTASSSEIVAGAIQDNDRGLILGRRSFGKGLVQRPVLLPDSSQIRLTVQRYYTPSGRCIQKDYTRGNNDTYDKEIIDRYASGEVFNADSVKFDDKNIFYTMAGRPVYGGGGIMPDVFVPSDTAGVTSYYIQVVNAGLLNKFAYEYADLNRAELSKAKTTAQLQKQLPSDGVLLGAFVRYASQNGVPQRWYYINISAPLIVNQLKALIARDILGMTAYFEIYNSSDNTVEAAIRQIREGVNAKIESAIKTDTKQ